MASLVYLFLSLLGLSIRHEPTPSTNLPSADVPVSSRRCGANEQYVPCVNHCNKCVKPPPQACSRICVAGCDCVGGYKRNASSVCIPKEQCEAATCPVKERRSDCVVPCNDCHTRGDCKFLVCNKGCDCQEGHFRNDEGECIPASECPSKSEESSIHMGGCKEAQCAAFCRGYGLRGNCKEAYPGGEKLCLCSK